MRKFLSLGFVAALTLSGPVTAAGPLAFTCDSGPLVKSASFKSLVRAYGAANVKATDSFATGPQTLLFPRDASKTLTIVWDGAANGVTKGPSSIEATYRSNWRAPRNVHVGMSLADLEAVNGRPIQFVGFSGAEGAGLVADWKGGAVGRLMRACRLQVMLYSQHPAPGADADVLLLSTDPAVRRSNVKVGTMTLVF